MGVRYVLDGSVRKAGNRVRITAQLIDAPSDHHLWAHRYDRDLEDIFELQDEISSEIAASVNVEIGDTEQDRANRRPTRSLDAWELHHRGMRHLWRQAKADHEQARQYFKGAIERDPEFSAPQAGLAYVGALDMNFGYSDSPEETLAEALAAGGRAIEIDERDAFGHFALGRIYNYIGDSHAAIAAAERAVVLSPSFAAAHYGLGFSLIWGGRAAEAIPALAMAIRLSPHAPTLWAFHTMKAWAHHFDGGDESAEQSVSDAFRANPREFWPHLARICVRVSRGSLDEARAACEELTKLKPEMSIAMVDRLTAHLEPKYAEAIVSGLRAAGLE